MQSVLDTPVLDIGLEPVGRRQLGQWTTGDQSHRLGWLEGAVPVEPGGLRKQGETGGFPVKLASDKGAGDRLAFLHCGAAHRHRIVQRGEKGGEGSGTAACTVAARWGWLPLTVIR